MKLSRIFFYQETNHACNRGRIIHSENRGFIFNIGKNDIDFVTLVTEYDPRIYIGGDNNVFWKPMSWAIIYGLTFATFLTLIIVPVMYWWITRMQYKYFLKEAV